MCRHSVCSNIKITYVRKDYFDEQFEETLIIIACRSISSMYNSFWSFFNFTINSWSVHMFEERTSYVSPCVCLHFPFFSLSHDIVYFFLLYNLFLLLFISFITFFWILLIDFIILFKLFLIIVFLTIFFNFI